jgi:hypothetical protein
MTVITLHYTVLIIESVIISQKNKQIYNVLLPEKQESLLYTMIYAMGIHLIKEENEAMNYFRDCKTLSDIKQVFREYSKKLHPDTGGNEEVFKEFIHQYEYVLRTYVADNVTDSENMDVYVFNDMLRKLMKYNIDIEIIGYWIYCYNAYNYRNELKEHGLWFSKKHKAWIYSGRPKVRKRSNLSHADVIAIHGCTTIKKTVVLTD